MSSVKDLINRFGARQSSGAAMTPVDYEKKRREIAQREAEEIKTARERARQYNAALKLKLSMQGQQQGASPLNRGVSERSVKTLHTLDMYARPLTEVSSPTSTELPPLPTTPSALSPTASAAPPTAPVLPTPPPVQTQQSPQTKSPSTPSRIKSPSALFGGGGDKRKSSPTVAAATAATTSNAAGVNAVTNSNSPQLPQTTGSNGTGSTTPTSEKERRKTTTDRIVPVNLSEGAPVHPSVLVQNTDSVSSNPLFSPQPVTHSPLPPEPRRAIWDSMGDGDGDTAQQPELNDTTMAISGKMQTLELDAPESPTKPQPSPTSPTLAGSAAVRPTSRSMHSPGRHSQPPPLPPRDPSHEEANPASSSSTSSNPAHTQRQPKVKVPPGGFRQIHSVVAMHRPSVSDLLLDPDWGERSDSITSVGPVVELPQEEQQSWSRLVPGVDVSIVLQTFYEMYAPEKLQDLELVLDHFSGRTEALLHTLETKYFVSISPEGIVTPISPLTAPDPDSVEDERTAARRASAISTGTDFTDLTTDSFKGYAPQPEREGWGAIPKTVTSSWAVQPKLQHLNAGVYHMPQPAASSGSGRKFGFSEGRLI